MFEQINAEEEAEYLHHDQQGSTRLLTNEKGEAVGSYTYTPYGATEAHTGTATTPLGYDGQLTSSDTGLIYLRARTYDPTTGQFMSVDPLVEITRRPYTYAQDNPVNEADPSGLLCALGYCLGFHPVAGLEGGANFLAGGANVVVSTATLGSVHVAPPFSGGMLGTSYTIGQVTAGVEAGVAGGSAAAFGARRLLGSVVINGVKTAPIFAPLVGGAAGSVAERFVECQEVSLGVAGEGAAGGLAGELSSGLFSGASADAVSGGVGALTGFSW